MEKSLFFSRQRWPEGIHYIKEEEEEKKERENLSLLCMGFYLRLMRHGCLALSLGKKKRWKSGITHTTPLSHTHTSFVYKAAEEEKRTWKKKKKDADADREEEEEEKRCTQVCCIPLGLKKVVEQQGKRKKVDKPEGSLLSGGGGRASYGEEVEEEEAE